MVNQTALTATVPASSAGSGSSRLVESVKWRMRSRPRVLGRMKVGQRTASGMRVSGNETPANRTATRVQRLTNGSARRRASTAAPTR